MSHFIKHILHGQAQNALMKEEVAATWFATALLISVMGSQLSSRDDVSDSDRKTIDLLFLSLACFIVLWIILSFYNVIHARLHRLGFCIIFLASLAIMFYIIFLVSQGAI
jgi:glucan phosphoethanolaminetransferase (alkaline phosphatase superfamily)